MKIKLDISQLLAKGKITQLEHDKMLALSLENKTQIAVKILAVFGVFVFAIGLIGLTKNLLLIMILCFVFAVAGIFIINNRHKNKEWEILGNIMLLIGSIGIAGCLVTEISKNYIFILISIIFIIFAVLANSRLLIALSALSVLPLAPFNTLVSEDIFLFNETPTIIIFLYSFLSFATYLLSKKLQEEYKALAIVFSSMCFLIVNFAFWSASLSGEEILNINITEAIFSILWALFLICNLIWAIKKDNKFILSSVTVFSGINFHEKLSSLDFTNEINTLATGITIIIISFILFKYNKK